MDIVIHCPGEAHKVSRYNKGSGRTEAVPKILLIASTNSLGTFKTQCNDPQCKRLGHTRGWYQIEFKPGRAPKITPQIMVDADGKRRRFDLVEPPVAVMEDK
ncbi:MAG: hypothetical protein ABIH23_13145 [bacterium]